MSFGFDDLQTILVDWSSIEHWPTKVEDTILSRVCQILEAMQTDGDAKKWHADLQPLIRHVLLRESKKSGKSLELRVPSELGWPNLQSWVEHGLTGINAGPSAFLLTAQDWHPTWLENNGGGVFSDAFSSEVVRHENRYPMDPFIRDATGFESYSSLGQREAVRGAFLIPEGETLIVNLPTGSGKSLVGQAPTLVHQEDGYLTLFVVPTVALAMDQERAMREMFQHQERHRPAWPLAWYSGLDQEERVEIRKRLDNGTQRILFTSPEALTTTLLKAIIQTARSGYLRYLVIDEAHLVTQWGDEFRPSFQALAGLRNSMLKLAPRGFRTLLLSATFTEETVETLANLFGPRERVQMVSAVHLRPEPQYWFYAAKSKEDKQERVLEALRHAPRPFILYVTKREEVKEWAKILRSNVGLLRVATFDGKTANQERQRVIQEWSANRLDGIIATSAFGVGLDKNDVRTVIHATIPETLDRYYQEVGRGGRDGKPSISLLVFDDSDWLLPKRLAAPKIISDKLGFDRWKAMYQSRQETNEETLWKIDIDAVHQGLDGGSEYNVNWNMRTLILMARAGLISLEVTSIPDKMETELGEAESSFLAAMANVRVRIHNEGLSISGTWETAIDASRSKTLQAAGRNLELMKQLLPSTSQKEPKGGKEVGETLCELYHINSAPWFVQVTHACGGCPKDRFENIDRSCYSEPLTIPVQRVMDFSTEAWTEIFPWLDPVFVFVFYSENEHSETTAQQIMKLTAWLIKSCGVREVAVNPKSPTVQHANWSKLYRQAPQKVLLQSSIMESDLEPYSLHARLTVMDQGVSADLVSQVMGLQRPFHWVLLPSSTPDPGNDLKLLADVTLNSIHLEDLIGKITQ